MQWYLKKYGVDVGKKKKAAAKEEKQDVGVVLDHGCCRLWDAPSTDGHGGALWLGITTEEPPRHPKTQLRKQNQKVSPAITKIFIMMVTKRNHPKMATQLSRSVNYYGPQQDWCRRRSKSVANMWLSQLGVWCHAACFGCPMRKQETATTCNDCS